MTEGWSTDTQSVSAPEPAPVLQAQGPWMLRQAREIAGLHIATLAAALKVPVHKLDALEQGRYEELPDLTFARALASSASRHLKIDPAAVLAQLPRAVQPRLGGLVEPINAPFKAQSAVSASAGAGLLSRPALWVAGLLLSAAAVVLFLPSLPALTTQTPATLAPGDGATPDGNSTAGNSELGGNPPSGGEGATGMATETVTPPAMPGTAPDAAPPEPAASASATAVANATTNAAPTGASGSPLPNANLLKIEATNPTWVEVVNGAGRVEVQRMLKAGDVVEFSSTPPYSVVLGRSDATRVMVRGQAFDVTPFARNSVARFEVK